MVKTRKSRGGSRLKRRTKRGGSLLASVVGALKTALPSIVLYEALRAQGRRVGKKSKRKSSRGFRGGRTKRRKRKRKK
jgi:hypothetical protein